MTKSVIKGEKRPKRQRRKNKLLGRRAYRRLGTCGGDNYIEPHLRPRNPRRRNYNPPDIGYRKIEPRIEDNDSGLIGRRYANSSMQDERAGFHNIRQRVTRHQPIDLDELGLTEQDIARMHPPSDTALGYLSSREIEPDNNGFL